MKKFLIAGVLVFAFGAVTTFAWLKPAANFADYDKIPAWARDASHFGSSHGYINGINGNFAPSVPVTRDQIAVMLHKFATNVHLQPGTKTFQDPWYGFQLTFPDSWLGYLYQIGNSETSKVEDNDYPVTTYDFGLSDNKGNFYPDLFTVYVFKKSTWDKYEAAAAAHPEQGPPAWGYNHPIVSNSSYVVNYTRIYEQDVFETDDQELNAAYGQIGNIIKTFKWIGN